MSNIQFILTIAVCAAATMLTRFLPFLVFGSRGGKVPEVVEYLGHVLPAAIFGMLIVYCLKGVSLTSGSHGIPEAIAIGVTVALHKWKHQTLVSIAGGTLCYVLLVQWCFEKCKTSCTDFAAIQDVFNLLIFLEEYRKCQIETTVHFQAGANFECR